jgi:hypothetical protein
MSQLSIYLSMALQPFVGSWPLFSLLIFYIVVRTPWTGDQPVGRLLPAHRTTQTQNKRKQTTMPQVGFEPTIPAFERAKTVYVLDHAATVIGTRQLPGSKLELFGSSPYPYTLFPQALFYYWLPIWAYVSWAFLHSNFTVTFLYIFVPSTIHAT